MKMDVNDLEKSIIVQNISKKYRLYNKPSDRIKDLIFPKKYGEDFYALRSI